MTALLNDAAQALEHGYLRRHHRGGAKPCAKESPIAWTKYWSSVKASCYGRVGGGGGSAGLLAVFVGGCVGADAVVGRMP